MKSIILVAGGTGGHINACLSLKETFQSDYEVSFISGTRYLDYQLFKGEKVLHFGGKTLRSKNPLTMIKNVMANIGVFWRLFLLMRKRRPHFVMGTGGYICGPSLLAAKLNGIPIFILEQNAAAGLTNKLLHKFSSLSFVSFPSTLGMSANQKTVVSGNPIRKSITYRENALEKKVKVLVFGGSLGAQQLNQVVQKLCQDERLTLVYQSGKTNKIALESDDCKVLEYIDDMEVLYHWSNIIIARSGASTVSELEVVKRPSILIPYRFATDNHQYLNAKALQEQNSFPVYIVPSELEGEELAQAVSSKVNEIIQKKNFNPSSLKVKPSAAEIIKKKVYEYLKR